MYNNTASQSMCGGFEGGFFEATRRPPPMEQNSRERKKNFPTTRLLKKQRDFPASREPITYQRLPANPLLSGTLKVKKVVSSQSQVPN